VGCGPPKKINCWVRPGVLDVRANARRPVSALISDDLPTLERPAKAISGPADEGSASNVPTAATNLHCPANKRRPASISTAEKSGDCVVALTGSRPVRVPLEPKLRHAVPPQARVVCDFDQCGRRRWTIGRAFGSAMW